MAVIISQDLVLAPASTQPLTHARIGIDTIATAANLTSGPAGEAGWPLAAVTHPLTYEAWRPAAYPLGGYGYIEFSNPGLKPVDYLGIAAHTLGTSGTPILLQSSDDGLAWTDVIAVAPGSDQAVMALFEEKTASRWRIRFGPYGIRQPQVAVIYLGKAVAMPRPTYGGHSPVSLSRITSVRPSVSETGQWLGRTIQRKGFKGGYSWRHIDPYWYRQTFDPFALEARRRPFFVAWRPADYPEEVVYCWLPPGGDPRVTNMGVGRFVEVSLDVEALDVS